MANLNMVVWKTIDSAPIDGTPIDLWCAGLWGYPVDRRYAGVCWDSYKQCWVDFRTGDVIVFADDCPPTHWAAIPRGPEK